MKSAGMGRPPKVRWLPQGFIIIEYFLEIQQLLGESFIQTRIDERISIHLEKMMYSFEFQKAQDVKKAKHTWKKKACVVLFITFFLVILFGCSRREDTSVRPTFQGKASDRDNLSLPQIESDIPDDSLLCRVVGDTLVIIHQDAYYQCCLEVRMVVHESNYTLDIVEYDVGQPCDCMCTFDLTTHIVGLRPGTYTVQVWSEFGQFHGKCTMTIPEAARLGGYSQSECLAYPKAATIESLQDSIGALLRDDTLFVTHFDAYYNCCFRITVELDQSGDTLNLFEAPTGDPCRCMCFFDIVSTVTGLTPGYYVIRVWNEDQTVLFGETMAAVFADRVPKTRVVPDEPPSPRRRWRYRFDQDGCKEYPKKHQSIK